MRFTGKFCLLLMLSLMPAWGQSQKLRMFAELTSSDSSLSTSFYIVTGTLACQDCYLELQQAISRQLPGQEINFVVTQTGSTQEMRNQQQQVCTRYQVQAYQVFFADESCQRAIQGNPTDNFYPKLVVLSEGKIFVYAYSQLFSAQGLQRKALRKIIKLHRTS